MGIHDRDYIREQRQQIGGGGARSVIGRMSMWSANTWIIILCVAVFVIDAMTPVQLVPGQERLPEGIQVPTTATPDFDAMRAQDHSRIRFDERGVPHVRLLDRPGGQSVHPDAWVEIYPMHTLSAYLHFSTARGFFEIQFWRLIGFQFLHSHLTPMHILFNMIGLFFFGPIVERYLGSKRYLAFYLLCGIFGALLYTLLNLGGYTLTILGMGDVQLPGLLFNSPYTPLIGASAGVFGVLMAGAYLAPRATVLLFFIIPMPLWVLAYGLVAFALFVLITGGHNAGGEAGHLGGAMAGFYFIRRPHHLHGFFDFLGRVDPTSHHYRKGGGARVARRASSVDARAVDRILDKINRQGIHSLTDEEKRILRDASRK